MAFITKSKQMEIISTDGEKVIVRAKIIPLFLSLSHTYFQADTIPSLFTCASMCDRRRHNFISFSGACFPLSHLFHLCANFTNKRCNQWKIRYFKIELNLWCDTINQETQSTKPRAKQMGREAAKVAQRIKMLAKGKSADEYKFKFKFTIQYITFTFCNT